MKKILMMLIIVSSLVAKTTISKWNVDNSASLKADEVHLKTEEVHLKADGFINSIKGIEIGTGYSGAYMMNTSYNIESFYDVGYYTSIAYKFKPSYGVRFTYSKVEDVEFIKSRVVGANYSVEKGECNPCGVCKSKVIKKGVTKVTDKSSRDVERYFIDALFYKDKKDYELYTLVGFGYSDEDVLYENNVFFNVGAGIYKEVYKGLGVTAEVKLLEEISDDLKRPELLFNVGVAYRF
jgi:hypothetical protein